MSSDFGAKMLETAEIGGIGDFSVYSCLVE